MRSGALRRGFVCDRPGLRQPKTSLGDHRAANGQERRRTAGGAGAACRAGDHCLEQPAPRRNAAPARDPVPAGPSGAARSADRTAEPHAAGRAAGAGDRERQADRPQPGAALSRPRPLQGRQRYARPRRRRRVAPGVGRAAAIVLARRAMVARMGGGEFALWVADVDAAATSALAQRIVARMADPITIVGQRAFIGVSIGCTLCPNDGAGGRGSCG